MAKKNPEADPALRSSEESDCDSASSSSEEETLPTALSQPTTDLKSTVDDFDSPLKSIVSKPTDDASKLKRPRSRSNSKPNVSPSPMKTPIKRPAVATADTDSKKPKTVKADPALSSSEESDSAPSSSEESDCDSASSSSEEETLPTALSQPTTDMKSTVDSGSESDDFDFDSPLKSIVSKPTDEASKLKRPRSSSNSKPNVSPSPMKTPIKRPAAATADTDSKKPKTVKASGGGEEKGKKSALFQRLWSDDDEVAVLKGMLDYKEEKGSDPLDDAVGFHDFIKDSVHVNVDRKQVVDKVRRLKKRFKNSQTRKTFNPHEKVVIELCKKIWGQKLESEDLDKQTKNNAKTSKASKDAATTKRAGNAKMESPAVVRNGSFLAEINKEAKFLGKAIVSMGLDEAVVAVGLGLCREDIKSELEEKWRKLYVEESNLFIRKLDLARQESEMITAALRSGEK